MSHYFRFMKFNKGLTVASYVFWATFEPPYPSSGSVLENFKGMFLCVRMWNGSNFFTLNLFLEQGDVIEQHWAPANVYTAEFQLLSY